MEACNHSIGLSAIEHRAVAPADGKTSTLERTITVCIVCCSAPPMTNDVIHNVSRALTPVARVQLTVLSDSAERIPDVTVLRVPSGTKLSKIRRLVTLV